MIAFYTPVSICIPKACFFLFLITESKFSILEINFIILDGSKHVENLLGNSIV